MIVNELITQLTFKHDKAGARYQDRMVKKLARDMDVQTRRTAQSANRNMSGYRRLFNRVMYGNEKAWRDAHGKMRDEHGQFVSKTKMGINRLNKSLSPLIGGLKNVALLAGGAGAAIAGVLAKKTFDAVGEKQMALTRLETVLGSSTLANQKYKMMANFAEVTPYQKHDLLSGFSSIAGSGYQLTNEDLTALGDLSAGSGKKSLAPMIEMLKSANRGLGNMVDNFDGMKAKASDGMLEMQRYDKQLKKWVSKTVAAGDMKAIVEFVRKHGERNYKGQMDKMSKAIPGMFSTLKDKIQQRFEDIGDAGADKLFTQMMERLLKMADDLKPLAKRFGEFSRDVLVFTKLKLPGYLKDINKYFGMIKPLLKAAGYFMGIYVAHWTGFKLLAVADMVWGAYTALKAMTGMQRLAFLTQLALNGAVAFIPALIGGAALALGFLAYDFYNFYNTGNSYLLEWTKKWEWVHSSIEFVYTMISALGIGLGELGSAFVQHVWPHIKAFVKMQWWITKNLSMAGLLYNVFKDIGAWLFDLPSKAKSAFDGLLKAAKDAASRMPVIGGLFGGSSGSASSSVSGSGGMLQAARQFAIGAPGQSAADRWAKSNDKVDNMAIKTLYKTGVACAASVEKIAQQAGASQAVLNAMTPSAPASYNNLLNQGLAELVPYDQLQGGEIFYAPDLTHTGIVGEGGKTFIHARNRKGKDIGMGQRFTSSNNYLGAKGKYLRIKPEHMNRGTMPNISAPPPPPPPPGTGVTIQQNFNGPANPQQVRNAAQNGTQQALHRANLTSPRPVIRR